MYLLDLHDYCFLILQLNNRLNTSKEEKRKRINYIGIGVSDEAQKVFNAIVKT